MITLAQLIPALTSLEIDTQRIDFVIDELRRLLSDLDEIEVKGRQKVDTLLGCMMAIEAIIGERDGK